MVTVNSRLEAIIYMVDNSGEDHETIAAKSGIHRAQIHRWLTQEVETVHLRSLQKVANGLGFQINHEYNKIEITKKARDTNLDQQYQQQLIKLQSEKITWLENEITRLKRKKHDH